MLWVYSVKGNEFVTEDVTSLTQLKDVAHNQGSGLTFLIPMKKNGNNNRID